MDRIKKSLKCPVCYYTFDVNTRIPRVLTCGHNLCSSCCAKIYAEGNISCPICKKDNCYDNVSLITQNYIVIEMIQEIKQTDEPMFKLKNNPF